MKKWLSNVFNISDQKEGYEELVSLTLLAKEDPDVREHLMRILTLPADKRREAMLLWISDASAKGAPEPFLATLRLLLDDELAHKTLLEIQATKEG